MIEAKIQPNTGDGLIADSTDNNLKVNFEPNEYIRLEQTPGLEGIFVEDLNGKDGEGGSRPDNHTTVTGTGWKIGNRSDTIPNFIDMNRAVVNLIFTIGLYKPLRRNTTDITYTNVPKDVRAMCNEIVAPCYYNPSDSTSYKPAKGELIQLVTNPTYRLTSYRGSTIACESINRVHSNNAQETKVMFVIEEIVFMSDRPGGGSEYWVYSMKLRCIYSSIPEYRVGTRYEGTQWIDPSQGLV